jgi:hypothetical protein
MNGNEKRDIPLMKAKENIEEKCLENINEFFNFK